jgi:psp operon transcriptional activator
MNDRTRDHALLGNSPSFTSVLEDVSLAAPLNRPVLIIGERGTGKELVAARVHYLSPRWDKAFVKLNCATLAETLLETELFGHEAGAFTGANKRHLGRFELAHEGTLFLDELATCSMRVQEKILRVLEYGEFDRVGGREPVRVDVRVVAATNADLPSLAASGKFREDLLDRLAFDVFTLPPMRERREDILLLAEHFAVELTKELGRKVFSGFSESTKRALKEYPWPGNVRELKNVVERAVYRHDENDGPVQNMVFDPFASPWRPKSSQEAVSNVDPSTKPSASNPMAFEEAVQNLEILWLKEAMAACKFNQRKTAEHLKLTYHQLRGYLRKYKLLGENDAASVDEGN